MPPPGAVCVTDLVEFGRNVTVRFPGMGNYTLRLTGRAPSGELGRAVVEVPIAVTGRD